MRMLQRGIVFILMVVCLLPMQYGIAELAPDRMDFCQERTEEREAALGDYVRWNYYERAMFCTIYGRRPGDYLNDEGIQDWMARKKKYTNKSEYPDYVIVTVARCLWPDIKAFFESEEGQREYAEWKAQQEKNAKRELYEEAGCHREDGIPLFVILPFVWV